MTFCVPEERRLAQFLHMAIQETKLLTKQIYVIIEETCKNCDKQNVASLSVFYLLKADRKKQKGAARSDDEGGAEHTKNSYILRAKLLLQAHPLILKFQMIIVSNVLSKD